MTSGTNERISTIIITRRDSLRGIIYYGDRMKTRLVDDVTIFAFGCIVCVSAFIWIIGLCTISNWING